MRATTQEIIDDLRRRGAERSDVELKSAAGGLPKSLRETISAFANGSGGTILLGVEDDLSLADIDPEALRSGLARMAAQDMEPAVRGELEIDAVDDGQRVVRFDVPESPLSQKPCFVQTKGKYGGSYLRVGDGDHRLTDYEVDRLMENRQQPRHDRDIVPEASLDDLDSTLLDPYLERMRTSRPRAFRGMGREDMMRNTGIARNENDKLRPTLAGLLVFGHYPQRYFPQLFVSVVVVPGTSMGELGPNGERFLDNRTLEGPLPEMAADAVSALTRHLSRAAVMNGGHRIERLEYPIEVVRELIVNALMHRDYSPQSLGAQVQVELYADRLVVRSPGGFYGAIDPADFGAPDISSSRNELIAKLLADTPLPGSGHMVAENRGSGIPQVMRALNRAGMAPPTFRADLRRVEVTVPQHALLTPEVLTWISSLHEDNLTDAQVQALALLRNGQQVRNQTLQGWGLHPTDATRDLTNLVQRGLADKVGDRRFASYTLASRLYRGDIIQAEREQEGFAQQPGVDIPTGPDLTARQEHILSLFADGQPLRTAQIVDSLPVGYGATLNDINILLEHGLLNATAPPRSKLRAYVRAAPRQSSEPVDER